MRFTFLRIVGLESLDYAPQTSCTHALCHLFMVQEIGAVSRGHCHICGTTFLALEVDHPTLAIPVDTTIVKLLLVTKLAFGHVFL